MNTASDTGNAREAFTLTSTTECGLTNENGSKRRPEMPPESVPDSVPVPTPDTAAPERQRHLQAPEQVIAAAIRRARLHHSLSADGMGEVAVAALREAGYSLMHPVCEACDDDAAIEPCREGWFCQGTECPNHPGEVWPGAGRIEDENAT